MMLPFQVFASEENNNTHTSLSTSPAFSAEPMSGSYLLQLVAGLLVVLLCIIALAWLAKKVNRNRFITDDSLRIIGALSMGPRERVVLMQVGESQLLIGVAPGQINTLHVLDTPIETGSAQSDKSLAGASADKSFSDKLKNMMTSTGNDKPGNNKHAKRQNEQ